MRAQIDHALGKDAARQKIDAWAGEFENEARSGKFPFEIADFQKTWSGDTLTTSFAVKKFFINANIRVAATALDTSVIVEVELPAAITAFLPEQTVHKAITDRIQTKLLS